VCSVESMLKHLADANRAGEGVQDCCPMVAAVSLPIVLGAFSVSQLRCYY